MSGLIYLDPTLLSRPQHHLLPKHAALQRAFQWGVTLHKLHKVQQNECVLSQDMYGSFLPPSEDSASHSGFFLHLLGTGSGAFLVFSHLLLTRTQPAPTMTEQARLKASLCLLSGFASCILSQLKVNLCPQQQKFLAVGASVDVRRW